MKIESMIGIESASISNKKSPKVSVCVVTYNQEKYISQCLQSLVDQKTDFDFEIVVADDCSTDATREIVRAFADKYPKIFRLFLHDENIGAYRNFRFVHEQAVGEYIAHMDGDDYALPMKLQNQVDFLDVNIDCNIVFHKIIILGVDLKFKVIKYEKNVSQKKYYSKDIIEGIAIGANSSKMYRASIRNEKLPDFDLVDYTVNVIQVGEGYAAYSSDKPLGVYREGVGISGSKSVIKSVYNSLVYFAKKYPECKVEINTSAWSWLISNVKNNRSYKWEFFKLALVTFSVRGLFKFISMRAIMIMDK
jgi:glycosyltransferase involved in cell wall biosynthesis